MRVPLKEWGLYHYSIYFAVTKKEGTCQPILDLMQVNRATHVPHFHMKTLQLVIVVVRQEEYLTSFDLSEAHFMFLSSKNINAT